MKTTCFKIVLFFSFLWIGISLNAQQTICDPGQETYTVDPDATTEPTADGTYAWTLNDGTNDISGAIISGQTTNSVTIDWDAATFDSYTLPHEFTLTVQETLNGCPGVAQTYTISLIEGYDIPVITPIDVALCAGDTNVFSLTGGSPGETVNYTITSNNPAFADITDDITLDTSGEGTINVPGLTDPDASEEFTLTLNSIGTAGSECDIIDIENVTETVTLNPTPQTSTIQVSTP